MVTLCLTMIVKNESKIITRLLDSIVDYLDYWVICDTGSTDGTQEIITEYFKEKGIIGELHQDEWKNFGYNRTLALNRGKNKADYCFVMDADDILVGEIKIPEGYYTGFNIKIHLNNIEYKRQQIFNNKFNWEYVGVVHEYANLKDSNVEKKEGHLSDCYIKAGTHGDRSNQETNKFTRDIDLLIQGIKDEPNNDRYHFYLANSYYDIDDYENAMKFYDKRISMGGWVEEVYYSMYKYAMAKYKKTNDMNDAVPDFLKAFNFRKTRLEAIYEVVQYYRKANPILGYKYGILAKNYVNDYPSDILFIDCDIHKFKFIDELAVCSYYANDHILAIELNTKLLLKIIKDNINLDNGRIEQNINFSFTELKKQIEVVKNNSNFFEYKTSD